MFFMDNCGVYLIVDERICDVSLKKNIISVLVRKSPYFVLYIFFSHHTLPISFHYYFEYFSISDVFFILFLLP